MDTFKFRLLCVRTPMSSMQGSSISEALVRLPSSYAAASQNKTEMMVYTQPVQIGQKRLHASIDSSSEDEQPSASEYTAVRGRGPGRPRKIGKPQPGSQDIRRLMAASTQEEEI